MEQSPKPKRHLIPWSGATLVVVAFLVMTILPAFIAFALTPQDAQVVTNVQGWNGCAYTVRSGDNLFRIGVRHGVTYQYLAQMNGIDNANYVWAGQIISVPCGAVPYPNYYPSDQKTYPPYQCPWCQPFAIPTECAQNIANYQVQPGDNLFRIAVDNGSTIQWIRTQNKLWGKVLRSGTTVAIPCVGQVKYGPNIFTPTPGGPNIVTGTPVVPTLTPANNGITMKNSKFRPTRLEVKVGTTVTWTNAEAPGGPAYNVTSGANGTPDGNFGSGDITPGGVYQFTFTISGSYSYFSTTNPQQMTGEVIVSP